MHLSIEKRLRIITLWEDNNLWQQKNKYKILKELAESERIFISERRLFDLIKKWKELGIVCNRPSIERVVQHTKITEHELNNLDQRVTRNRELTAKYLKHRLRIRASVRTVQKYLNILGWRKKRTRYCQYVTPKNRYERIFFARLCLISNYSFERTIFIDGSCISADKNAPKRWHKHYIDETRYGLVGKYSNEQSVQVIGGISKRGPTDLVIYDGRLNSNCFQELFTRFGIPIINEYFPIFHSLQMDNAPCHSSRSTRLYLQNANVNHLKTPAQSPDINPIELVWHDLKVFIAEVVKPNTKEQLINGIREFWRTKVTPEYCNKKINH